MLDDGGPRRGRASSTSAWTVTAVAVALAVIGAAVVMVLGVIGRVGDAIEAMTPVTLAVAVSGGVVAVIGASVLAGSPHRDLAVVSTAASFMAVTMVALTVLGIVVLPVVIALVVVLARRASGRHHVAVAVLTGPLIAIGTAVLLAVWVQPPLVECETSGVRVTSRPWWDSSSGSGSATSSDSGTSAVAVLRSEGTIDTPSGTFRYRCDGDVLVEFRHEDPAAERPRRR